MEPTFSRLIWRLAVANTGRQFKSKLWDALYVLGSLLVGCGLYFILWGLPRAMTEALPIIMFSFAPLGIFVFCVFLWHLCIAPDELVYNAVAANPAQNKQPFKWAPWKLRDQYTIYELAKILARNDPAEGTLSTEAGAYARLILEKVKAKKIK